MNAISLAGKWTANIKGEQTDFYLPGTACENHIGNKQEYYERFSKDAVRAPIERYEYIGELSISRELVIPEECDGKYLELYLERVNVSSKLYIDNVQIDRQEFGFSTPHIYELTGKVKPGKHIFRIVLNNEDLLSVSNMSSGYSLDTQGYWNGVIGRIELRWENICHIKKLDIYPKEEKQIDIRLTLHSDEQVPEISKVAKLKLSVEDSLGVQIAEKESEIRLFATQHYWNERITIEGIEEWDEFNPRLYKIKARLYVENVLISEKDERFGYRILETKDKHFILNGKRIFLRGNVDCAQFPKTGYPPMTREVWEHNFMTTKEWGLNMIRFHGWCPPEVAFEIADEIGLYLQVEMPLWLNKDVTKTEVGDDSIHYSFFLEEMKKILQTYGNHPSFMFFSNGNENMGDFCFLEDLVTMAKALDNRHLYAITSNFDHPVVGAEDFFLAQKAYGLPVRIQNLHDEVAKASDVNFDEAVNRLSVPLVNFEVGQYAVYPDVDIIDEYDGNMLPVNFDVIKKEMLRAGVYEKREEYIKASGDIGVRLYKEDVEAVYRTKDMNGYQLLCIQDYTGQYTATVGILDVMYKDKGIVDKNVWRQFVSPVVPLFEAKRIYVSGETISAKLGLHDFGKDKIIVPNYKVDIYQVTNEATNKLASIETSDESFEYKLDDYQKACELKITVSVNEYENSWSLFVFPKENECELTSETKKLDKYISCQYIPVFWSPVLFETDKPSGAIISNQHPLLKDFPGGKYPNYQWKTILDNAKAVDLASLTFDVEPIIELVPNYEYNLAAAILFIGEQNGEKAIYSGIDFSIDDIPTKYLKKCIVEYAKENEYKIIEYI